VSEARYQKRRNGLAVLDWRRVAPDLGARCRAHVASRFTLDHAVAGAVATFNAA